MREPTVYIIACARNGTLCTASPRTSPGASTSTARAPRPGFTSRYGCTRLVWYEPYPPMVEAIAREKQIRAGSRQRKLALIEATNPDWRDLYPGLA